MRDGVDLLVESRQQADGTQKVWCVKRQTAILAINQSLYAALDSARTLAQRDGCTAWLLAEFGPIEIGPISASATSL